MHAIQTHPGLNWYLWCDSAFDAADDLQPPAPYGGFNMYDAAGLERIRPYAPWLMPFYSPGENTQAAIQRITPWMDHASGRPMLSFMATVHRAADVAAHLREFSWATAAKDERMLLRLADTRSVVTLANVLRPEQWVAITRPLAHWFIISREGLLEPLSVGSHPDVESLASPIQLDDDQINAIASAAEPDGYLHHIATELPEILPPGQHASSVYSEVVRAVELATRYAVNQHPDLLSLIKLSFATRGEALSDERLIFLLAGRDYQAGQLQQTLLQKGLP
ncbi:DUF4123 domain-containing protein [Methylovorus mays]|uniref:DUF4123 domain-containing protein n=1 Tax=Methylovorus mays TaxID=184077 RepID=UPI001E3A69C3|nr:DUF4123 domain-containing protein [Methylovorus mays]MCB5206626.1 DUF4123 domain-containing protein [Methylovorus mays]